MIKIIPRYIFKEFIPPFIIGMGFFTFIFILNPILRLVDLIIVKNVDLISVLKLFFYLLPSTLAIVFPMATLVAILVAYGRLSTDLEITALRACGINYFKIFLPAIWFGIIVSIFGSIFNDTILPEGNFAFKKLYQEIVQKKPLTEIPEHTLTALGNRIVGIEKINHKENKMSGIVIIEKDERWNIRTIIAKTGKWVETYEKKLEKNKVIQIMRLQLEDGVIQQAEGNIFQQFSNINFKRMIINFTEVITYFFEEEKGSREKNVKELINEIKKIKNSSGNVTRLLIELHKRFSIPFAALAFVLIGAPLGIITKRSAKSVSLGISAILIIVYYIFYTLGESLARQEKLNEFFGLWLPNFIFALAGSIYIYFLNKK
jgi:lipopolysaccharide export system permease protein